MTGSIAIGDIVELRDMPGRWEILDIDWPGKLVCVERGGVAMWVKFSNILAVRNRNTTRTPASLGLRKKVARMLAEKL